MELIVYADESGTFDKEHNNIFTFGGVICIGKECKDIETRKYLKAERDLRLKPENKVKDELKACKLSNKDKGKLFRSLNNVIKFGVVVEQKRVLDRIFDSKKDKQRYLDYVFKIGLKRCFERLAYSKLITLSDVRSLNIYVDEHTTATNGRYELKESLEQEFKNGTYNLQYSKYYEPIFKNLEIINLHYCNSEKQALIRAADIVANRIYYHAINDKLAEVENKIYIHKLPN